jgi:hypothetical protein
MKKLLLTVLMLALPLGAAVAFADDGTDAYIDLMRSDLRADKKAIVTVAMDISDADSKAFWPIYDEYEKERKAMGDRIVELIKKYPDAVNVTGPETIRMLSADWFKLQDDRVALMKKYYKKAEKQISPRVATRWMQVEYRLTMLINLQIAAEVPLVEPIKK